MAQIPRRQELTRAPRTVIGYHGCTRETADRILGEQQFLPSARAYDWLWEGVYFWEYAPYRALDWAIVKCAREGGEPAVLRAAIKLGRCLNLLDINTFPDFGASIAHSRTHSIRLAFYGIPSEALISSIVQ